MWWFLMRWEMILSGMITGWLKRVRQIGSSWLSFLLRLSSGNRQRRSSPGGGSYGTRVRLVRLMSGFTMPGLLLVVVCSFMGGMALRGRTIRMACYPIGRSLTWVSLLGSRSPFKTRLQARLWTAIERCTRLPRTRSLRLSYKTPDFCGATLSQSSGRPTQKQILIEGGPLSRERQSHLSRMNFFKIHASFFSEESTNKTMLVTIYIWSNLMPKATKRSSRMDNLRVRQFAKWLPRSYTRVVKVPQRDTSIAQQSSASTL